MKKLIYLELVLMALFWGGSFTAAKIALQELSPLALITIRFFFVTLLLIPILLYFYKKGHKIEKKDYPKVLLLAILGFNLYFILEVTGIKFTDASKAVLIINLFPLVAVYLSAKMLKERTNLKQKIAMAVALFGAYILVTNMKLDFLLFYKEIIGALLVFAAVISAGFFDVFSKKLLHKYNPLFLLGHSMVLAFFLFMPFYLIFERDIIITFSQQTLISILYLAITASILCYWILYRAIKVIGVSRVSVFHYLIPVFGVIIAFLILKERITMYTIIGGIIIIGSVYVFSKGREEEVEVGS